MLYLLNIVDNCTEGEWHLWSAYNTTPFGEGIPLRCSNNGEWQALCRYHEGCSPNFGRILCKELGIPDSSKFINTLGKI